MASMFQVRIHGRGGQGVVTAAELLSVAAFRAGRHAQAFPSFGSERTGAPVVSFCRIADGPIRSHDPVAAPDALIIQDVSLLGRVDVLAGLVQDGYVLLNTVRTPAELGLGSAAAALPRGHVVTVPASELAMEHVGRPVPNVPLLGAFAALTGVITLDGVVAALEERFPGPLARSNAAAAEAAYRRVVEEAAHAPAA
ncbi:pyruvate ferredoxin oxidoreductase gamma subunit [Cellulomonas humilata]|uniref:Pyruvate ferredoxin oxidoreductase gamma subunit n=2 Tax=Cellulomonas humilata TaxID=144055 RepID=A0ABU0EHS7_9CELL|nr:pyruvate ferredoxin oxidoreductase gamma subunit [Cellulomonas humilata]